MVYCLSKVKNYVSLIKKIVMKVQLSSDLLVPMPEYAGKDLKLIHNFKGDSQDGSLYETVGVWAVNAEDRAGILAVCAEVLCELQKSVEKKPLPEAVNKLKSFEEFVKKIGTTFEHEVPEGLLAAVSKTFGKPMKADNVIYMSGVSYME